MEKENILTKNVGLEIGQNGHLEAPEISNLWKHEGWVENVPLFSMPPDTKEYPLTQKAINAVLNYGLLVFTSRHSQLLRFNSSAGHALALEMIHNPPHSCPQKVWEEFVGGTEAARSVKYRLGAVAEIMKQQATDILSNTPGSKVNILSIACGASRAPLQVVAQVNKAFPQRVEAFLNDSDPQALKISSIKAKLLGISSLVQCYEGTFPRLRSRYPSNSADIVEAVGIGDYLNFEQCTTLFKVARRTLKPSGKFIYTNICSTREKPYLDIVWKPMYYRDLKELINLIIAGGFDKEKTILILDPTQTMCIVITEPFLPFYLK